MKIELEKEDIIKYFDNMECNNCPFKNNCNFIELETNRTLCSYIINCDYD